MPCAPVEDQTAKNYKPPHNIQFSLFLVNRVGKLLELTELFESRGLRIVAVCVLDTIDHAVVRLLSTDSVATRRTLSEHKIPFSEADVLVVELGHDHDLSRLCMALLSAEINIDYTYGLLVHPHHLSAIVLHTDNPILAGQILQRKCFTLLGEDDLAKTATDEAAG